MTRGDRPKRSRCLDNQPSALRPTFQAKTYLPTHIADFEKPFGLLVPNYFMANPQRRPSSVLGFPFVRALDRSIIPFLPSAESRRLSVDFGPISPQFDHHQPTQRFHLPHFTSPPTSKGGGVTLQTIFIPDEPYNPPQLSTTVGDISRNRAFSLVCHIFFGAVHNSSNIQKPTDPKEDSHLILWIFRVCVFLHSRKGFCT